MKRKDLTMHRILGEHSFKGIMNEKTWEYDQVCEVCGITENKKPVNIKTDKNLLDQFRYNMIGTDDILDELGILTEASDLNIDAAIPEDLERELLKETVK